jgi:hypothetical protein
MGAPVDLKRSKGKKIKNRPLSAFLGHQEDADEHVNRRDPQQSFSNERPVVYFF